MEFADPVVAVAIATVLVACGSDDTTDPQTTAQATTGGVMDTSGGASAPTEDSGPAETSTAQSSDDDATDDTADSTESGTPTADSSGGVEPDTRLYPLELDRSWTYDVETFGDFPTCTAGAHDETVLSSDGTAFEVQSFCPAAGTSTLTVDGDFVQSAYMGDWITVLDIPVEEGHLWNLTPAVQYEWRDADEVRVPAGTFTDCWTRWQIVDYTAYTVYCRGVGMVRSFSMDLAGGGWHAQLSAMNF